MNSSGKLTKAEIRYHIDRFQFELDSAYQNVLRCRHLQASKDELMVSMEAESYYELTRSLLTSSKEFMFGGSQLRVFDFDVLPTYEPIVGRYSDAPWCLTVNRSFGEHAKPNFQNAGADSFDRLLGEYVKDASLDVQLREAILGYDSCRERPNLTIRFPTLIFARLRGQVGYGSFMIAHHLGNIDVRAGEFSSVTESMSGNLGWQIDYRGNPSYYDWYKHSRLYSQKNVDLFSMEAERAESKHEEEVLKKAKEEAEW